VTRPTGGRRARILVVGDLMIDTIVKPEGRSRAAPTGAPPIVDGQAVSAANQAAWLAHFGAAVDFVARVGAAGPPPRDRAARARRRDAAPGRRRAPRDRPVIAMVEASGDAVSSPTAAPISRCARATLPTQWSTARRWSISPATASLRRARAKWSSA